jgi:hypothetical protein
MVFSLAFHKNVNQRSIHYAELYKHEIVANATKMVERSECNAQISFFIIFPVKNLRSMVRLLDFGRMLSGFKYPVYINDRFRGA